MDGGDGGGSLHENCVHISKLDIPGTSLNGRNPADLTIPQLKQWLKCRNAPMKGKKADLVPRYISFHNVAQCANLANESYRLWNNTASFHRVQAYIDQAWLVD